MELSSSLRPVQPTIVSTPEGRSQVHHSIFFSAYLDHLICRCTLQWSDLIIDHINLPSTRFSQPAVTPIAFSLPYTHNLLRHITLHYHLIQPLRILAHATSRCKLLRKEFGHFFQIDIEGFKAVNRGDMFTLVTFLTLDGDLREGWAGRIRPC